MAVNPPIGNNGDGGRAASDLSNLLQKVASAGSLFIYGHAGSRIDRRVSCLGLVGWRAKSATSQLGYRYAYPVAIPIPDCRMIRSSPPDRGSYVYAGIPPCGDTAKRVNRQWQLTRATIDGLV